MKYIINSWLILLGTTLTFHYAHAQTTSMTLMLDWFVNPNHGPIVIAKEKGYFQDNGLYITIQEPADPNMPPKLVAAGTVDLAVSYQPALTLNVAEGLPLVRASTLVATPLNTMMVLKDGNIKQLEDLVGKKVGIAISGSEKAVLGTMLNSVGKQYSDIEVINVGWALSSSLASGKVAAIWGGFRNFETHQLALEGYRAKAFYPEEWGVPAYDELVIVAHKEDSNRKAIAAFNQALEKAVSYIVNHPEEAWLEFVDYSKDTLDTELNRRAWADTLTRFALRPAAYDSQRYETYAQFMLNNGIITKAPSAQQLILQSHPH